MQEAGGNARKAQREAARPVDVRVLEGYPRVLESHADAMHALDIIHRSAVLGRIPANAASVAVRAVDVWVRAKADALRSVEFEQLKAAVARLEAANDELAAENARLRAITTKGDGA